MNNGIKILVVDDSPTLRKIIRTELESGGYVVEEAEDGVKALLHIASANSPPDLITLDMEMPTLDGFGTCKKLQGDKYSQFFSNKKDQRVPIIFITSNDTLADRKTGFELGASDFITKPFAKGEILAAVNKKLFSETRLKSTTALVVDDTKTARHIISRILRGEGVNIIEAENGEQAFEIMCKQMSGIDLLITDLYMPKMNGDELCKKVRQELNLQDLPIIFLTAMSEQSELLDLFKAGGTDYIVKPFVKEELLARLNVHLERTELNKRLKSNVNELRTLNKMKDNLLSVCSHDLRTPLNGILGFADLMLEKNGLPQDDKESLTDIKASGELLLALINDILDLSKIQSEETELEMEPIYAVELIHSSYNAMKHMALTKNQKIGFTNSFPSAVINGNRSGMIRVINNLLSNAIKFTPDNGQITLLITNNSNDEVTISVADSGIGIPKDKIPHLFDKFTKTSQDGTSGEKGTGLGMSIVKEIVEMHNGSVAVTSVEGKGTCFNILLPLTSDMPKKKSKNTAASIPDKKQTTPMRSLNVLLADDNPMNVKVTRKMLTREGHTVIVVENGSQALEAAQNNHFDVILMDMQMPEMDGPTAARELRERGIRTLPIIALTANTGQKNIDACLGSGMNDFLSKPFKSGEMNAKLSKWCSPVEINQ